MEEAEGGGGFGVAFLLTLLSGISTGLGGVVVILIGEPSISRVGLMEAFAAGVMIYLSIVDLAWPAVLEIGTTYASLGFMVGGSLFWGISLIPIPSVVSLSERFFDGSTLSTIRVTEEEQSRVNTPSQPSDATNPTEDRIVTPSTNPAISAQYQVEEEGVMIEPKEIERIKGRKTPITDVEEAQETYSKGEKAMIPFLRAAIVTAIAISLHNFPEGVAVYLASLKGIKLGVILAIGISLHNIPEGMSVAAPIYFITRSKLWAVLVPLISGMFEPLGALMAGLFLYYFVTQAMLQFLLSCVAGIMCFLSFSELFPIAVKHSGIQNSLLAGGVGMVACYLTTTLVEGTSM